MEANDLRELRRPRYSAEERALLIDFIMAHRARGIRNFLEQYELPKSGTKAELRERIETALDEGGLSFPDAIRWLDRLDIWNKQHVFLYSGPEGRLIQNWRNQEWVDWHLNQADVGEYVNARLSLILPNQLRLSSISYSASSLSVVAVERRDYWERDKDKDESRKNKAGQEVELRAYIHHVERGLVRFEWNLTSNEAMLQVSQLPSGTKYEAVAERFSALVDPWLDLTRFSALDISPAIGRLHEAEEAGNPEARSHAIDYSSVGGRRLAGRSPTSQDSLLGEDVIDRAMDGIRRAGVGHLGNFYWLPSHRAPAYNNPLNAEVHVERVPKNWALV